MWNFRKALLSAFVLCACGAANANWQAKVDPALLNDTGNTEWLIELPHTANLGLADNIPDKVLKGAFVMQMLQAQRDASQPAILAELAKRGLETRSFWISNAIHVKGGNASDLADIAALPAVDFIHAVKPIDFSQPLSAPLPVDAQPAAAKMDASSGFTVEPALELVRATEVWATGVEGQGVVVGDHDIGVFWEHPALKHSYRGWDADTETATHPYNWRNAFGSLDPFCGVDEPCDSHDHGTHTTGTMVGEDREAGHRIGMAPRAEWMGCRSLFDPYVGVGTVPTYLDCMEWFIAPYPNGDTAAADPAMAPDVVNNSWGCLEACPPTILQSVNEATKAAGIVQVASAGNEGPECFTLAFAPAIYDSSFTVGSTTLDDVMSSFSSRGMVLSDLSMRTKPNVVAPGSSIRSSLSNGDYGTMSGTSMAGPHVAGLVALVISAEPRLRGQVDTIRELIESTAVPISNDQACGDTGAQDIPNNTFGYGRIDAKAAVDAIAALGLDTNSSSSTRGLNATPRGGALNLGLLFALLTLGLMTAARHRRR